MKISRKVIEEAIKKVLLETSPDGRLFTGGKQGHKYIITNSENNVELEINENDVRIITIGPGQRPLAELHLTKQEAIEIASWLTDNI